MSRPSRSPGVAISASLLPPAVNTGLYWAMAMLSSSFGDSVHNNGTETLDHIQVGELLTASVIFLSHDRVQDFKFEYAEYGDIPLELFWRGMISLTLTCLNILCIVMVGTLMLLLKQVGQDTRYLIQNLVNNWTYIHSDTTCTKQNAKYTDRAHWFLVVSQLPTF